VVAGEAYSVRQLRGENERANVRRGSALVLFVLGESALASLSFGVAALPALVSFVAGSALLLRS
jgi:hypothetical protein